MLRAIGLFLAFAAVAVAWGMYSGFWQAVPAVLFAKPGIGGLSGDYAVGLVTEATAFVVQLVLVGGIFGFIASWRSRRNHGFSRAKLAKGLVSYYSEKLNRSADSRGPLPGAESAYREKSPLEVSIIRIKHDSVIDPTTEDHLDTVQESFERFYFETAVEDYDVKKRGEVFLQSIRSALGDLKQPKKVRQALGAQMRAAMVGFSKRIDHAGPSALDAAWSTVSFSATPVR